MPGKNPDKTRPVKRRGTDWKPEPKPPKPPKEPKLPKAQGDRRGRQRKSAGW
jgi:hypothetical protein